MRGIALATGLAIAFSSIPAGCGGSSGAGGAPAELKPEIEQKTQDMLKNKSQQYNERYRKKAG